MADGDVRGNGNYGWRAPSAGSLLAGGSATLFMCYTAAIALAIGSGWPAAARDALVNVATLVTVVVPIHSLLKHVVMKQPVQWQLAVNCLLAPAFALTWYALVIILFAFFRGISGDGFAIIAFSRPAFVWQTFQGLTMYGLVAAACYAIRGGREAAVLTIVDAPPLTRYLTRLGDDMMPVEVRDIVSIVGAQDYSEVSTICGRRHLVRMSLAEFGARLDRHRFLRVHRSTTVNFDHLTSAEPAGGGRLLANMANGDVVRVSRAGAQGLRALVM